ncbi:MAG: DUF1844 domain-containing protein [Phycisphaerae bacterium]
MSDDTSDGGIYVDSDWKEEAAREKARLAEQEAKRKASSGQAGPSEGGSPIFLELVNFLAMQAMIGLGGYRGPGGESIPPNADVARHHIDMLTALSEKTKGNLTDEESKMLEGVLYELRMHFVQQAGAGFKPPPSEDAPGPGGPG